MYPAVDRSPNMRRWRHSSGVAMRPHRNVADLCPWPVSSSAAIIVVATRPARDRVGGDASALYSSQASADQVVQPRLAQAYAPAARRPTARRPTNVDDASPSLLRMSGRTSCSRRTTSEVDGGTIRSQSPSGDLAEPFSCAIAALLTSTVIGVPSALRASSAARRMLARNLRPAAGPRPPGRRCGGCPSRRRDRRARLVA